METIKVDELKSRFDLRQFIAAEIGMPRGHYSHSSKQWYWQCPFHHERNGTSFSATADSWRCWGKCGESGDIITWVMKRQGLNFKDACKVLAGSTAQQQQPRQQQEATVTNEPPAADWQQRARRVVEIAQQTLWSDSGRAALEYLRQRRGLSDWIIQLAGLGYIGGTLNGYQQIEGLNVPCGILIPWECDGVLWAINVRRGRGAVKKYQQVTGSHIRGALYGIDRVPRYLHNPILFVEGEFDSLIGHQALCDLASVVTLGGWGNRLQRRWLARLSNAQTIIAATDTDEAGNKAAQALGAVSSRVERVAVPTGKDLTDFYQVAGDEGIRRWFIEAVL
jgi:DNA primase